MGTSKTKTEGAIKGGSGQHTFNMAELEKIPAGTGYSTSHGGVVEGERMLVGYIHKPKGTGARMHTHPNEQFNFVLKGTLHGSIDGHDFVARKRAGAALVALHLELQHTSKSGCASSGSPAPSPRSSMDSAT